MLLRLGSMMSGGAAALGGAAGLAAAGPFVAGIGTGVALVGGACLVRKAMRRRTGWRDHDAPEGHHEAEPFVAPDEGEAGPIPAS